MICFRDHAAGQQRAGDPGAQAHCQAVHQVQSFSLNLKNRLLVLKIAHFGNKEVSFSKRSKEFCFCIDALMTAFGY
jgi:hypothetical protein